MKLALVTSVVLVGAAIIGASWKYVVIRAENEHLLTLLRFPHLRFDRSRWQDDGFEHNMEHCQRLSMRQRMIRDITVNLLPGKHRDEIIAELPLPILDEDERERAKWVALLGHMTAHRPSRIPADEWKVSCDAIGLKVSNVERVAEYLKVSANQNDKQDLSLAFGQIDDTFNRHLGYYIGQCTPREHGNTDPEILHLRFDETGRFASWFIAGCHEWPLIVGEPGSATYAVVSPR